MTDYNQFYRPQQIPSQNIYNPTSNVESGNPDFFVSPEMLKFGLSAGQDMINRQKDRWMPGVSSFWETLRFYFSVNNRYVYRKIQLLLYPLSQRHWSRSPADDNGIDLVNPVLIFTLFICHRAAGEFLT